MQTLVCLLALALSAPAASPVQPALPAPYAGAETRVEITPAVDGSDLITFFRNGVPQVSILRDTLGDEHAGSHRFRQVWAYTYVRPSLKQRLAAAIPFFYHRAGRNAGSKNAAPAAILDISNPRKGTAARVAAMIVQANVFDSYGAFVRAPTRSYRGNTGEYRDMHLERSLQVLEGGTGRPVLPEEVQDEDWDKVRGRVVLAERLLGGYVSDEYAGKVAPAEGTESAENRGSNWDFLRQLAEQNGLYIEPLVSAAGAPSQGVLWFAQGSGAPAKFESAYLGISNPWTDPRVSNWNAFTRIWDLNRDGVRVEHESSGAVPARMIPLAVYALDYPRVPLLLVDFRDDRARRREVMRRAAEQVTTGIFGMTPYSSLSWFTARQTYLYVQNRRGHALNRGERLSAYARLQQTLLETRSGMDLEFRKLLETKLDQLALNPFEQDSDGETILAERQYAALRAWAESPDGLGKTLARERAAEYFEDTHSAAKTALLSALHKISFGLIKPCKTLEPEGLDALNRHRRLDADLAFLREIDRTPDADVVWDSDRILEAAEEAEELGGMDRSESTMVARIRTKVHPTLATAPLPVPVALTGAGQ